jgi:hypothetical protein
VWKFAIIIHNVETPLTWRIILHGSSSRTFLPFNKGLEPSAGDGSRVPLLRSTSLDLLSLGSGAEAGTSRELELEAGAGQETSPSLSEGLDPEMLVLRNGFNP